jgi:hypothetical protein
VTAKRPQLSERQRDVLAALVIYYDGWARPMDVGAIDGSHHCMTLRALVKKGLAERKLRGSLLNQIRGTALYDRLASDRARGRKHGRDVPRGSYEYRITGAGKATIDRGSQ